MGIPQPVVAPASHAAAQQIKLEKATEELAKTGVMIDQKMWVACGLNTEGLIQLSDFVTRLIGATAGASPANAMTFGEVLRGSMRAVSSDTRQRVLESTPEGRAVLKSEAEAGRAISKHRARTGK